MGKCRIPCLTELPGSTKKSSSENHNIEPKIRVFAAVIASALALTIASTAFAGDLLTCGVEESQFPADVQDAINTIKSYYEHFSEEYVCEEYMYDLEDWEMETLTEVRYAEDTYEMYPSEKTKEELDTMIRLYNAFGVVVKYLQFMYY